MRKSMKERLIEGERITITSKELEELNELVPHVTLHYRMKELEKIGVFSTRVSRLKGGRRWTYEGRDVHFVHKFVGQSEYKNAPDDGFSFPHDLAVDLETNSIIASART